MDRSAWSSTSLSRKTGIVSVAQLYIAAGLAVAPSDGDEWARVGLYAAAHKRGLVVSSNCSNLQRQGPEYRVKGQAVFDYTGTAKNLKIVGKQHFHAIDAGGYALSVLPTKVVAVDLDEIRDAFEIPEDVDEHSRRHWLAHRSTLPKVKGRQSILTPGLDDDYLSDYVGQQFGPGEDMEDALAW